MPPLPPSGIRAQNSESNHPPGSIPGSLESKNMADTATLTVELNAQIVNQLNLIREAVWNLRNEVNCRIEHGAESGGHLDYVQRKLDEILQPISDQE